MIRLATFILFFSLFSASFAQVEDEFEDIAPVEKKYMSIQIAPALFSNTVGLEIDRQIGSKLVVSLYGAITYGGSTDNDPLSQLEEKGVFKQGIDIELKFKRYINTKFSKLFVYAMVSYNTIEYLNIDKKPVTLYNHLNDDTKKEILENNPKVTNPLGIGAGVGYQYMMIPDHLFVSIQGGVVTFSTITNVIFPSLYLQPAIGYKF